MALALSRNLRCVQYNTCQRVWGLNKSPMVCAEPVQVVQVATLQHMGTDKYPYVKPFPYWRKKFTMLRNLYENSNHRMCEQSKVIVVEGSPGVGKHKFAERLAKEFDLMYFRGLDQDDLWMQYSNGFNRRDLNEAFDDEECRVMNFSDFYNDPNLGKDRIKFGQAARMQFECLTKRTMQYTYALLHLLSTGQGFVTVRSPYSDPVFARAMRDMGYLSGVYTKLHLDQWEDVNPSVLMPHLNIYLHAPVDVCMANITKRQQQDPTYAAGPNLNEEYLSRVEHHYRNFMDESRRDHEVLELDWAEAADESELDVIWEFISKIELLPEDVEGVRFHDWHKMTEDRTGELRRIYQNRGRVQHCIESGTIVKAAPEFSLHYTAQDKLNEIYSQHPMTRYDHNFITSNPLELLFTGGFGKRIMGNRQVIRSDVRYSS